MKMRRIVLHALLLALPAASVLAREPSGPRRNLMVELRWVESSRSAAAVAGVRDAAVVVGTTGSVSPRASVTTGTQERRDKQSAVQRVIVLNGYFASISLGETVPVRWLEFAVDLPATASSRGQGASVVAAPRTTLLEQTRGFTVSPHWPGGAQAVRVEFHAQEPASGVQGTSDSVPTRLLGTLLMPLDEWTVVARSGQDLQTTERGVLSSRDAERVGTRELQLRIGLAP